jgi:hypothetical protein
MAKARWLVALMALALPSVTRAEPAQGFMLQGELALTGNVFESIVTASSVSLVPTLRLGALLRNLSVALEAAYDGSDDGNQHSLHLFAFGANVQPVVWRSADGMARLNVVLSAFGGAGIQKEPNGFGTTTKTTGFGGFAAGIGGHYFLHRSFALGLESGVRAQFVDASNLEKFAALYVALVGTFVAGH